MGHVFTRDELVKTKNEDAPSKSCAMPWGNILTMSFIFFKLREQGSL